MSVTLLLSNVAVTHMNDIAIYFHDFYTHSYIFDSTQCSEHKIGGKQKQLPSRIPLIFTYP
jgi:hypothetical protein